MSNVKTQKEYNQIEKYLVSEAIQKLGITEKQAKLRIKAIVKSGILNKFGSPDQAPFQIAVDAAMQIPQLGKREN